MTEPLKYTKGDVILLSAYGKDLLEDGYLSGEIPERWFVQDVDPYDDFFTYLICPEDLASSLDSHDEWYWVEEKLIAGIAGTSFSDEATQLMEDLL